MWRATDRARGGAPALLGHAPVIRAVHGRGRLLVTADRGRLVLAGHRWSRGRSGGRRRLERSDRGDRGLRVRILLELCVDGLSGKLECGDVVWARRDCAERRALAAEVAHEGRSRTGACAAAYAAVSLAALRMALALVLVQPVVCTVAGEQRERLGEQREVGGQMRLALLRGVGPERCLGAVDLPLATASATSSPLMCTGVAPSARIRASVAPDGFTRTRAPAKSSGDASGFFAPKA